MALFSSYAQPGVYTQVEVVNGGIPAFGNLRIPVLIGEGTETFTFSNIELFRGSSSVADDQVVSEDLSAQITQPTRTLQLGYFPIVTGKGTGDTNVSPANVQIVDNGVPVTVLAVDSATGQVTTQDEILPGDSVQATYFFSRHDTQVVNEDLSGQIPAFATTKIYDAVGTNYLNVTLSLPGELGNLITVAIEDGALDSPPTNAADAVAVSGAGTDNIVIQLRKSDNSARTLTDIFNLIYAGIPTLDSGYLVAGAAFGSQTGACEDSEYNFSGGVGQSSNTVFKVANTPIVDGSNGGVVTTDPSKITVLVNGSTAVVSAVNGATGLITMTTGVASGSTFTVTYYFNHYQDTFDLLPGPGAVASLSTVGLGPNRNDYIQSIDYVLGSDPVSGLSTVNWGANASTASGKATAGFTPFNAVQITTTLVDETVYLVSVVGSVNGKNANFTLADSPTDGSGLSRATDDPTKILVYAGTDPVEALAAGALRVIRLDGDSAQFTLFNPPAAGLNVYATYYRNQLHDHVFTLAVVTPQINVGGGTYSITDEAGDPVPTVSLTSYSVAQSSPFATTGLLFPNSFSDLSTGLDGPAEVITVTFQPSGSPPFGIITPALQASGRLPAVGSSSWITFRNTTPGAAGNSVTVQFVYGPLTADSAAVTSVTNAVTVQLATSGGATRTLGQIVALFAGGILTPNGGSINSQGQVTTTAGGIVIATLFGAGSTLATGSPATPMTGGQDAVYQTKAVEFIVTSTNPKGTSGTGYLGQTFESDVTGVKFTIVDPASALSYGYTQLPDPQYAFAPSDYLVFTVSTTTPYQTGLVPTINVPGIQLEVASTYGMNTGDTAIVTTFDGSGNEPNVGEYYFVTYETNKTAKDMALQIWTNPSDAFKVYGQPSTINRLSLGVSLLTQNGTQQFGTIQVPKQTGLGVAADVDFIAAIQSLAVPFPLTNRKADVIVPLSTSASVQGALSRYLSSQASPRNKGEAIGFIGPNSGATPADIASLARAIANERVILIGNPVAGVQIDTGNGDFVEYAVSGEFMAAAVAGLNCDPANDVAQSLLNQQVVGFSRLLVKFDGPTMDIMSASGVTPLVENAGVLELRDYLTTDPSSILTSEPTATTVTDNVRQTFRAGLKQFIGRKFLPTLVTSVQATCNSMLQALVANEIVEAYTQPVVTKDPTDPTTMNVTVSFKPIFTLKYINVTFAVDVTL